MAKFNNIGGDSASNLTISTFNVNSIGKNPKRQQIFNFLRKKKSDINILVDTRISRQLQDIVKQEWGASAYFSCLNSQSREVAILFKKFLCIDLWKPPIRVA